MELFSAYKKYYQRWYRNQTSIAHYEMKELAHHLVQQLYFSRHDAAEKERKRKECINIAQKLIYMEREQKCYSIFGKGLLRALEENSFFIDVPYPVERRWATIDRHGEVYIVTAPSMNQLSKLGATTMDIDTRIRKYENRYGYTINLFYSIEIIAPFSFEKYIADIIKDNQVRTKSDRHTNEWYSISPDVLQKTIESNIGSFLNKLKEYH